MFCNLNSDWSLLPGPFCFRQFCLLKGTKFERKNNFLIILFQNILLLKEFFACNGCFRLITKITKKSGTSFCFTFSAWFFYKNVFYLILHLLTWFYCHTFFPSKDIKQNVIELFRQLMTSWSLRFIFDHPLEQ